MTVRDDRLKMGAGAILTLNEAAQLLTADFDLHTVRIKVDNIGEIAAAGADILAA